MKKKPSKRASKRNVSVVIGLVAVMSGLGILLARAYYDEKPSRWVGGRKLASAPVVSLAPHRGGIFDRHFRELAVNTTAYSICAYPLDIQDPAETAAALAGVLKIDRDELVKTLTNDAAFVWVVRRIGLKQAETVRGLNLKGISFVRENCRLYPRNNLASQVLGFADAGGHGADGVELAYDHLLAANPLSEQKRQDAPAPVVFAGVATEVDTRQGNNLILTIDADIQALAQRELYLAATKNKADCGTLIVSDVRSGAILAMANHPGYDPNTFWEADASARRNHAITDACEVRKLIKLFEGVVAAQEAAGKTQTAPAAAPAERVGIGELALGPSPRLLYDALLELGAGRKTGIPLPNEDSGSLRPYSEYEKDATALFQGEGVFFTPLQLVTAFSAMVNGGTWNPPYLLLKVADSRGRLTQAPLQSAVRRLWRPETAEEVRRFLVNGYKSKSGSSIQVTACSIVPGPAAAPAGDQPLDNTPAFDYIKYFLGSAPLDQPEIAVLMILEGTCRGETSHAVTEHDTGCAMTQYVRLSRRSPKQKSFTPCPERDYCSTYSPKREGKPSAQDRTQPATMPDVRGKCMREALCSLQKYDVSVAVKGSGVAVRQTPAPGTKLKKHTRCTIEFRPS